MVVDKKYMQQAIKLATKGIGSVEPNPAVGAVIVKNGKIIGKGYHKKFGGRHAEINALADCRKKGYRPAGATMYVTLEPCSHFGKTPPCCDAVVKAKIKRVVAATKDPSKKVAGKGLGKLRKAGIEVKVGVCEDDAKMVNPAFFKFEIAHIPYVILKWAQSKDGFLSRTDGKRWITNTSSRRDVHKLRKTIQGILVGVKTVLDDDPMLTTRPDPGVQPLRIVLDGNLKTPIDCKLVETAKKSPVIIFTTTDGMKNKAKVSALRKKKVEIVCVRRKDGRINLKAVLKELGQRNTQRLLVEGGKKVITSFLKERLADEVIVYTSDERLGKAGKTKISAQMNKILSI